MHRALTHFVLAPSDLITALLLIFVSSSAWLLALPWLCRFWQTVMQIGIRILALDANLETSAHHVGRYLRFAIPYPTLQTNAPEPTTWWLSTIAVGLIFAATYLFPRGFTPVSYLIRAALFVQATALVYFLLIPAAFPHTPSSYMEGLVSARISLISILPMLFGLTFYIFQFSLTRKIVLTAITMAYLSLCLPIETLLQALVLQKSVLFMPVLYIMFGIPVDIMIVLAFYSWGMSWPLASDSA